MLTRGQLKTSACQQSSSRQSLVIEKVSVAKSLAVELEFRVPKGTHSLKSYIICDSYLGVDHYIALDPINVAEVLENDFDEDMDSDE